MSLLTTSSQTVGPYVKIGFTSLAVDHLAPDGATGERVTIRGVVVDGDGKPVTDGVVEIWQANAHADHAHPGDAQDKRVERDFRGFARILTDDKGGFRVTTIKPGRGRGAGGT